MSSSVCLHLLPGPEYYLKSRIFWAQLAVTYNVRIFTGTLHSNLDAATATVGLFVSGYCSRRTDGRWLL